VVQYTRYDLSTQPLLNLKVKALVLDLVHNLDVVATLQENKVSGGEDDDGGDDDDEQNYDDNHDGDYDDDDDMMIMLVVGGIVWGRQGQRIGPMYIPCTLGSSIPVRRALSSFIGRCRRQVRSRDDWLWRKQLKYYLSADDDDTDVVNHVVVLV
jgi:hypothetical protein